MNVVIFGATGMVGSGVSVGRAMIAAAVRGYPQRIVDPEDIARLASAG